MTPRTAGVPVAYLRRSRVQSTKPGTVSHETQLAAVRRLVDDPRLVILEDWGVSGQGRSTRKRTGYAELRRMIEAGECSQLVSYNMSRLARSVSELLDLMQLCDAHGVPVRTVDGQVNTTTATGRMTTTILAAIDQMNAEVAREASIAGQVIARADGKLPGRPAYGTRPGQDPAAVVAAFTEAGSLNGCARLLNERKVPTWQPGGSWGTRTVKAILNRNAPGTIPAGARQGARSFAPHALSGLLVCPCGRTMTSAPRPSGVVWLCHKAHTEPQHSRPYIVSERKIMPAIKEEAGHYAPKYDEATEAGRTAELDALHADLARIKTAAVRGILDMDEAETEARAVRAKLAALDATATPQAIPQAISWSAPVPELNAWLRAVWSAVQLGPDLLPVRFDWTRPDWRRPD
jgi:DNA invertase Pin-like site-specific DNA recombinase